MVKIPILRWGQPFQSLEHDKVIHFMTGETLAEVSQANPGLAAKYMKKAQRARDVLREIPCSKLILIGICFLDAPRFIVDRSNGRSAES